MAIDKGVFQWTGFQGAPGYSIFYALPSAGVAADIKTFFTAISSWLPTTVTISCPTEGDTLEEATGILTGSWSGGPGGTVIGGATGTHAGPAGAAVTWDTSGIATGAGGKARRVRGRTFLVPLATTAYESDGTLVLAARNAIQGAADALVSDAAGNLVVWHRPIGGAGGSAHPVTGARVADKVAVLRSRRD